MVQRKKKKKNFNFHVCNMFQDFARKLYCLCFQPSTITRKKKKNVYQVFNTNANVFSHCFDRSPSFLPPPRGLLTICTPNKEMLHMFICTQNCIKPF